MDALHRAVADVTLYPGSAGLALLLGTHGLRKGSLAPSGAIAATVLGFLTLACPSRLHGALLLAFYFAGSRATKYKAAYKAKLEGGRDGHAAGGRRDAIQVGCNALVGTIAARLYDPPPAVCPLSPSLDDSWTSPRFLVLLSTCFFAACMVHQAPAGTNGAISAWGSVVSCLGGLFIGLAAVGTLALENSACRTLALSEHARLIAAASAAGLVGSLLDSLLGATLQQTLVDTVSGRIVAAPSASTKVVSGVPLLSNNAVNAIASTTAAIVIASVA